MKVELDITETSFTTQGETVDDTRASALAYLLSNNNVGVGLYHSKLGVDCATVFKKKKTNAVKVPAIAATATSPAVPEKTTYAKNDCK